MAEGLYRPETFDAPTSLDLRRLLGAIVKVRPHRTLEYRIFDSEEEAELWSETVVHDNGSETFRLGMTDRDVERCDDAEYANRLFRHEFCRLVDDGTDFPASVRLRGHANGIAVAGDDRVVTCFHLATGPVEAAGRSEADHTEPVSLAESFEVEVPVSVSDAGELEYEAADEVELMSNPSAQRAFGEPGFDAVTLRVRPTPCGSLELRTDPVPLDEELVLAGFGMRTARPRERRERCGYEDVHHDLRLSEGRLVGEESSTVALSDLDAAPGHSGSPVVDLQGRLVGMYVGSTGNGIVDPTGVRRRHLRARALAGWV